jgi:hypothetical protein
MVRKIGLIIFGIIFVVFFGFSLYLMGNISLFIRRLNSLLHNNKFSKQICCIGDSRTFGAGAFYRYGYPKLEILLNLNNPGAVFNVVNLGIPGNSTKYPIERLADFLEKK